MEIGFQAQDGEIVEASLELGVGVDGRDQAELLVAQKGFDASVDFQLFGTVWDQKEEMKIKEIIVEIIGPSSS